MSEKQIKRARKEIKKTVIQNFGVGMEQLSHIVRKRPRWIPKSIWMLAYAPLFSKKYRRIIRKYIA